MKKTPTIFVIIIFMSLFGQAQSIPSAHKQKQPSPPPSPVLDSTALPAYADSVRMVNASMDSTKREQLKTQAKERSLSKGKQELRQDQRFSRTEQRAERYRREYEVQRNKLDERRTHLQQQKEQLKAPAIDSATLASRQQQMETEIAEQVSERVNLPNDQQPIDLKEKMQSDLAGYRGYTADPRMSKAEIHEKIQSRIEQLGEDYEKVVAENIQKGKKDMQKQKRKFTDLSSNKDAANNRLNPLAQLPASERFRYGTNFRITPGNTTQVSLSPELSYLLYPKVYVGMGLAYEFQIRFDDKRSVFSKGDEGLSTRFFSQYLLPKGFFAHGEYVWIPPATTNPENTAPSKSMNRLLVGLGKQFNIKGRVTGNLQLLYNVHHDPLIAGSKQWEYRFGFNWRAGKKKQKDPQKRQ
ncbi:MAG: hypothetical protein AAF551_12815 [Bacteroidota bacterium]